MPATGVEQVYYPGEIEYLRTKANRANGIELAEATYDELAKLAAELGVKMPLR
jgi:LDH2 family malate/lactate/ureidoglycolate dehydrogenase